MADQIQRMLTPPPHPPTWKKGGAGKNMALEARFQKLREGLAVRGTEFSEGGRFSRATMFLCKCVISVATLLLIIHTTIYILISLI